MLCFNWNLYSINDDDIKLSDQVIKQTNKHVVTNSASIINLCRKKRRTLIR